MQRHATGLYSLDTSLFGRPSTVETISVNVTKTTGKDAPSCDIVDATSLASMTDAAVVDCKFTGGEESAEEVVEAALV